MGLTIQRTKHNFAQLGLQYWNQFQLGHVPFKKLQLIYFLSPKPFVPPKSNDCPLHELKKQVLKHELFISKDKQVTKLLLDADNKWITQWNVDEEKDGFLKYKLINSFPSAREMKIDMEVLPPKLYTQRILFAVHSIEEKDEKDYFSHPVLGFHAYVQSRAKFQPTSKK
eukprot:NODE_233_length_12044_cov_0.738803.p6 type:complete len:169 gc:universal NODE_233_length_12044_cov_0.738803:5082-5588(+)